MDYLELINEIIEKLRAANEVEKANHIASVRSSAFMASELLLSVTHSLLKLLKENEHLSVLISNDVKKLKDYCWSIGLNVR